jgi:hypothetical protein
MRLKRFNESLMPRVIDKEEAFNIQGRERVPFKSSELDVIKKILLVDKSPRFKDITYTNWFSLEKISRIAFECHVNRHMYSKELNLCTGAYVAHIMLRIFKFDDDWFLIEELPYGDWSDRAISGRRLLLADQFEEVRNYLEGL